MKNLLITSNDIANKLNQVVETIGEKKLFDHLFAVSLHNFLDGKKIDGDAPTFFFVCVSDEIDFCELHKINGCEFLDTSIEWDDRAVIYDGYYSSKLACIAETAFVLSAYITNNQNENFFSYGLENETLEDMNESIDKFCRKVAEYGFWKREFEMAGNDKKDIIELFGEPSILTDEELDELGMVC